MEQESQAIIAVIRNNGADAPAQKFLDLYARLDEALTDGAKGTSSGPSKDDVKQLLAAYKALKQMKEAIPEVIRDDILELMIVARENELGVPNKDCSQIAKADLAKYMDGLDALEEFKAKQQTILGYSLFGEDVAAKTQETAQKLLKLLSTMLKSGVNLTDMEIPEDVLRAMNKEFDSLKKVADKSSELMQALETIAQEAKAGAGWVKDALQAGLSSPDKVVPDSSPALGEDGQLLEG